MKRLRVRFVCGLALLICCSGGRTGFAATFHVDPSHGTDTSDGSAQTPWRTLQAVFERSHAWQPGDVVLLHAGDHGRPVIKGRITQGEVRIERAPGSTPRFASISFRGATGWTLDGATISPEGAAAPGAAKTLVSIDAESTGVTVRNCTLYSVRDVSTWKEADWLQRSVSGIACDGERCTIADNQLRNVRFGIALGRKATESVVLRNTIENFMSDGLRGLADRTRFEGNVVKNCYAIDDNHDDGFQSWSVGPDGRVGSGVVKGVIVRGNTFISYTDPAQPYKAAMQGIGCFDGMFEDWVVENNIVVTDMWHGIAFYGAKNCRIANNTVVKSPINAAPRTPWIQISPHKRGAQSSGNVVSNNITPTLHVPAAVASVDHNVVSADYDALFVNYAGFDLHPRPGSPAANAGAYANVAGDR